jgi:hypothetical protein
MAQAEVRNSVIAPDADFLEFLGSWNAGDGRWTDPFQVDDPSNLEGADRRREPRSYGEGHEKKNRPAPSDNPTPSDSGPALPRRDVTP